MACKPKTFNAWNFTEKFMNPHAKWKKLDSEAYIWCDSVFMMVYKSECIGSENRSMIDRIWVLGEGKIDYKEDKRIFEVDRNVSVS